MNMNEIVKYEEKAKMPSSYQNFDVNEMERFYQTKQYLSCFDGTELLETCIFQIEEKRHYDGIYQRVKNRYYTQGMIGPEEHDYYYIQNYTTEKKVWISCELLMNRLDSALYFWRELNPELVRMLTVKEYVEKAVIGNWVKMIQYMAPKNICQ